MGPGPGGPADLLAVIVEFSIGMAGFAGRAVCVGLAAQRRRLWKHLGAFFAARNAAGEGATASETVGTGAGGPRLLDRRGAAADDQCERVNRHPPAPFSDRASNPALGR